jgi:hypothetical protein
MTDIESIRLQIRTRLPIRARWLVRGTPIHFDFSRSETPLKPVMPCDFNSATIIEEEWTSLRIFGENDYSFLGIHWQSCEVFRLDVEQDTSQIFLLNSDIDRFIRTFLTLDRVLGSGGAPAHIAERLREIDPGAFERSEWRLLSDYVTQ